MWKLSERLYRGRPLTHHVYSAIIEVPSPQTTIPEQTADTVMCPKYPELDTKIM